MDKDKLIEALQECEEYFADCSDAEYLPGSPSPRPNEEMRLLALVREALAS